MWQYITDHQYHKCTLVREFPPSSLHAMENVFKQKWNPWYCILHRRGILQPQWCCPRRERWISRPREGGPTRCIWMDSGLCNWNNFEDHDKLISLIRFDFSLTKKLSIKQHWTVCKQKKVIKADSAFIILLILWDSKNGQVGQGDQGIESGLLVKWPV